MKSIKELLKGWYDDLEKIRGTWNGKEPGREEDRASSAEEAQGLIDRLADIFDYLHFS